MEVRCKNCGIGDLDYLQEGESCPFCGHPAKKHVKRLKIEAHTQLTARAKENRFALPWLMWRKPKDGG